MGIYSDNFIAECIAKRMPQIGENLDINDEEAIEMYAHEFTLDSYRAIMKDMQAKAKENYPDLYELAERDGRLSKIIEETLPDVKTFNVVLGRFKSFIIDYLKISKEPF